ncbi:SbcC/MukB-like Walker B domain-containing protein [Aureimonas pseudogalii]|uniref:ATPase n=1 Tax=Aureimonas pseudogalii TaxID=1744844 RepID=A0A7W6EBZ2_9HYPH|nr:SbcC/MukB-like Walker B domain-containing protein [Aureimonas pseudogalii]MBB3998541.1 hypothetical protein [Aureimonas pseudogalii]
MYSLRRISLVNWYLVDAKDIEIRGEAALIGPTGAGKSSIQDAIQTVITGVNANRLNLNASASGRSSRSVLEYCLGMTGDPAEDGRPLRSSCETILALTFVNDYTDEPIAVGVALAARHGDSREEVLSRFIVPGHAFTVEDIRRGKSGVAPWAEIAARLRALSPEMSEHRASAERFTSEMLAAMRGPGQPPNARHFLRAFSNALAFKPIFDPTIFVRDFVLEPEPLDVERVRASIATWRELERLIEDAESRHRHVRRIAERFRVWATARLGADRERWRAASAEARRCAHEVRAARATLLARLRELEIERGVLTSRREWIRNWDDEIRSRQALLAQAGGESQLRQIAAEAALAGRDLKEAEAAWTRIRGAFAALVRLAETAGTVHGAHAGAVDAARQALALAPEGTPLHEALRGRGDRLQALAAEAAAIEAWSFDLDDAADRLAAEARQLESDLLRVEGGLQRPAGAILSRETTRLLAMLTERGIPAVPLCDVVEVVDAEWQYAAEALLGRGREAVIVEPRLLPSAFDLMWSDRNAFAGCTLVKTSATRGTPVHVPKGSIVEALRSDDEHARAFLAVRIGAFRKAETDAELDRLDRGVMRNGKTSSGMGLSVQRDLRDLVLGRGVDEGRNGRLEAEATALRRAIGENRVKLRLLREAARGLPAIVTALRAEPGPFDLEHRVSAARLRTETLSRDRRAVEAGDASELRAEIDEIRAERDAHATELAEEVEPRVQELQGSAATARAKLDLATEKLRGASLARRRAWSAIDDEGSRALVAAGPEGERLDPVELCARFRERVRHEESERRDAAAWLSTLRNDARAAAEASEGTARREQLVALRDLTEYAASWKVAVPAVDADTMVNGYLWIVDETARLETHELRGYRDACAKAGDEMRRMLREDLLARLSEKLGKVSYRLAGINRLLKRHRFTGQTYAFTYAVNTRLASLHALAERAAAGELTDEVFDGSMGEVEAMIEGGEDAVAMADYRQYFTFEIVMTDARGGRTTLSSRALKGSGGEAQVPFYVAIAASLALAYFPGHVAGKPAGMGLALFDEAFNKLDVPNTQALLQFFRDMGLQLLIAGPEDKRATFTEVLDTIVLVNKSLDGRSVYIDTEHPGAAAKAALARLNPDHRGIEGFRSAAE